MSRSDRAYVTGLVHSPRALWLALVLALFAALAPAISHALVAAGGQTPTALLELCTSSGMRSLEATRPGDASHDAPASAPALADCPFCWLDTDRLTPAPYPAHPVFLTPVKQPLPRVEQTHFCQRPWALAPPPRGPPFSI